MPLKPYEYTAPSSWASYLINGDDSGIDDESVAACDKWLADINKAWPVSCEDAGFRHEHSARHLFPYAADCQTYVFLSEV